MPAALAHERVGAVGADDPAGPHGLRLAGRRQPPGLVLAVAAERERGAVRVVDEPLGDPAAVDGSPGHARTARPSSARSSSGWKNR